MALAIQQFDEIVAAPPVTLKRCPRCEESKPLSEYGVCRARKDGLNLYCKLCIRQKISAQRVGRREYRRAQKKRLAHRPARIGITTVGGFRRKITGPIPHRILVSLKHVGPQTFPQLRYSCRATEDQLSEALTIVVGRTQPVMSKNGTGPRVYFLNPNYDGKEQSAKSKEVSTGSGSDRVEESLSFSNLNLPTTPVIKGGRI